VTTPPPLPPAPPLLLLLLLLDRVTARRAIDRRGHERC